MTERQYQTIRWAVLFAVLASFLLSGCGSFYHFPAAPSEMTIASIVMNECQKIGITAQVVYVDEQAWVDGGPYGMPGISLPIAMGAVRPDMVKVYLEAMQAPHDRLVGYARHECCHLKLNHIWTPERTEEAEANTCVAETEW
jgi:hypothetical protein